jgi:hypothetical protein
MPNVFVTAALAALLGSLHSPDAAARATLDTAIARMGGLTALQSVERARVEMVTEWQRTALDGRPTVQVLSYEMSTELRDYTRPAWRYTRRFPTPTGWREVVDLVVDSVAAIKNNGTWGPQNVAYVDERREMFTFSPERLVLLARQASDARSVADTVIRGTRYARVRATVEAFPVTLCFGRTDGALALAYFRGGQPKDFGLAPWGDMDVAIWYSRWQRLPQSAIQIPTQLDIWRVGRPYKRMTLISMQINPTIDGDSLAMPDSLRARFLALRGRAMFDLPVDSARIVDGHFAVFGTPGTPAGAVKVGGRWLLVEAGTASVSVERSVAFLERADAATPLGGAFLSAPNGDGGVTWLVGRSMPTWVSAGARAYAEAVLRGWRKAGHLTTPASGGWLRVGTDSAQVETIDIPDYPQTAVLYVPSLRWVYAWPAFSPVALDRVAAHVRARGWKVDRVGSARGFVGVPLPGE